MEYINGIVSIFKLTLAIGMLGAGLGYHFDWIVIANVEETTYGEKAAILALAAASAMLLEILPNGDLVQLARVTRFVPRLAAALLAFGASYNWLSHETDNNVLPYISVLVLMFVVVLLTLLVAAFQDYITSNKHK